MLLSTGLLNVTLHLILDLLELDVVLDDVDVGGLEEAANFSDIGRTDHRVSMEACHGL